MDIALYISTILQEQDEVSVPGLGTFFKENAIARFDAFDHAFRPPGTQIAFREEVSENKALVEYISKIKNISPASADYFAEKFGREINKELQSSGSVNFGELGVLQKTRMGLRLNAKTASFSPANFGLIAVPEPDYIPETPVAEDIPSDNPDELQATAEQDTVPQIEPPIHQPPAPASEDMLVDTPPVAEHLSHQEETDSVAEQPKKSAADPGARFYSNIFDNSDLPPVPPDTDEAVPPTEDEETIEEEAPRKRWIKEIVAVLLVAGLTFAGYFYRHQLNELFINWNNKPAATKAVRKPAPPAQPKTLSDSLSSADSIVEALKRQGLQAEKPLDTVNVSTKAEDLNAPGTVKSYEIVGPSFAKMSQATAFIKNMHSKGVYAYIIQGLPGTRIKVGLGSFKDLESAALELPRIQKDIYPNASILPIK
ncbi:MAG: hypothetical protein K0S09_2594 [Sphingobacteriaceae bacterium]|jgi:nucleoid DNA-binding protein|nr:hypothetical protein [Sphingobacteriaceae bacterium]